MKKILKSTIAIICAFLTINTQTYSQELEEYEWGFNVNFSIYNDMSININDGETFDANSDELAIHFFYNDVESVDFDKIESDVAEFATLRGYDLLSSDQIASFSNRDFKGYFIYGTDDTNEFVFVIANKRNNVVIYGIITYKPYFEDDAFAMLRSFKLR